MRSRDLSALANREHDLLIIGGGVYGLEVKIEQIWYFPPSPFAKELVESVRRAAGHAGYPHMDIVSGAGHDACYVSRVAPTAMVFVPCKDGISHNEIEDATRDDIGAGCQILLQAMIERANA